MRPLMTFLFVASTLCSQGLVDVRLSSLDVYLELTLTQVAAIADLNRQLASFDRTRTQRQSQLQVEIAQETAREPIDVNALGLRYRELELIRREMEAQRSRTREQLQTLLTGAQKTKLATLQAALQLRDAACAAIDQNLLVLPPVSRPVPPGASFLLGPVAPVCPASFSTFTFGGFTVDTTPKTELPR